MIQLAAALVLLVVGQTAVQLPDESRLPGQPQPRPDLPAESLLPGNFTPTSEASAPLPPESVLPGTSSGSNSQVSREPIDEIIDSGRSPDAIPWLSFNLKGHLGPVRAIAFADDGARFFTGGEDKRVLVWSQGLREPAQRAAWGYERTIRWQIQRGPRGRIHCLAQRGRILAIAGYGAWGTTGEILLVDSVTGGLITVLRDESQGNRDVIAALAISPDVQRPGLAAIDRSGHSVYWSPDPETGNWSPRQLHPPDRQKYGAEVASALQRNGRQLAAVAMQDADHAIVPTYLPDEKTWSLDVINVHSGRSQRIGLQHRQLVTAMAATLDGSLLATADGGGSVFLWDLRRGKSRAGLSLGSPCISLAFRADGRQLATGMFKAKDDGPGMSIWSTGGGRDLQRLGSIRTAGHVYSCSLSPDGGTLVFADGNDVLVHQLQAPRLQQRLRAPVPIPLRVAFAGRSGAAGYQLAIGTRRSGAPLFDYSFDTSELQLNRTPIQNESWLAPRSQVEGWSVRTDRATGDWHLYENEQRRAKLPIDPRFDGAVSAACFLSSREGRPFAVAVGTTGNNNIYVFDLVRQGEAMVMRVLRGHSSEITSLAASDDLRYLASASADGTIRFWPLGELEAQKWSVDRWGAEFEVQENKVIVTAARSDGPVYFRGIRTGDEITSVAWFVGPNEEDKREATAAPEILSRLRDAGWNEQLVFTYVRGRAPAKQFQIFPAWQQLATLVVAENREWAFWTPSGYYDASFQGDKLFGWQVNRGVERLPDYFLSSQLKNALERPDVMSRLLEAGNIEAAFELAMKPVPAGALRALKDAYVLKPEISIDSPQHGDVLSGNDTEITATVSMPPGERLAVTKAFANGVVARLVDLQQLDQTNYRCRWIAPLPADRRVLLQVVAGTEAEIADSDSVTVDHEISRSPRKPRIFITAVGVNQYIDAQIPRLDYAVRNADEFAHTLRHGSAKLYQPRVVSLTDRTVTRSNWSFMMEQYLSDLQGGVHPDDLLVIFLSGHGVRDETADDYYFVTANTRFADVRSRRFASCISFQDFSLFSKVSCRKIVILDTCHSGAIQPLRQRQLKSALRALQDDVVLTLTASEGGQEAVESREQQLGRFTNRLLQALSGAADADGGNRDGVVSWSEVIAFVKRTVVADSGAAGSLQFPTAGPEELLDVMDFPLTAPSTTGDPS